MKSGGLYHAYLVPYSQVERTYWYFLPIWTSPRRIMLANGASRTLSDTAMRCSNTLKMPDSFRCLLPLDTSLYSSYFSLSLFYTVYPGSSHKGLFKANGRCTLNISQCIDTTPSVRFHGKNTIPSDQKLA